MSDVAVRWGALIKRKRIEAGLNQASLGEQIGRPQSIISRWENGKQSPTLADQERLFRVIRITADDLYALYAAEDVA